MKFCRKRYIKLPGGNVLAVFADGTLVVTRFPLASYSLNVHFETDVALARIKSFAQDYAGAFPHSLLAPEE
jgi:hypothetical protein